MVKKSGAKPFFIFLFFAIVAYGQQTSIAVLPSDGTALSDYELEVLTDKMHCKHSKKFAPTTAQNQAICFFYSHSLRLNLE